MVRNSTSTTLLNDDLKQCAEQSLQQDFTVIFYVCMIKSEVHLCWNHNVTENKSLALRAMPSTWPVYR